MLMDDRVVEVILVGLVVGALVALLVFVDRPRRRPDEDDDDERADRPRHRTGDDD